MTYKERAYLLLNRVTFSRDELARSAGVSHGGLKMALSGSRKPQTLARYLRALANRLELYQRELPEIIEEMRKLADSLDKSSHPE